MIPRALIFAFIFLLTFSPLLITGAPNLFAGVATATLGSSVPPTITVTTPTTAPPLFTTTTTLADIKNSTVPDDFDNKTTTTIFDSTTPPLISSNVSTITPNPENSTSTSISPSNSPTIQPTTTNISATTTNIPTPTTSLAPIYRSLCSNEIKEKLINSLKNAIKLWDKMNLENILKNKGIISNETTDKATESFYNIFILGQMCSNWLRYQKQIPEENQYQLFLDLKDATQSLIRKTKTMNLEIDNGLIQENIFDPKEMQNLNSTLGRKYVNQINAYFINIYQYNAIRRKFSKLCNKNLHNSIASDVLKVMNKSLRAPEIQNDPLNEIIFAKTANVFVDGMKHFIMINMACDVLPHEEISFRHSVVPFLGKPRNDMNQVFYNIYANDYIRKLPLLKKEFKNGVISIIDKYLEKYGGESQTEISEKIYKNLISQYPEYKFAVGVYSQPNALLLNEGDNVFSNYKTTKGKNAFVIANQKSPTNGYKECKFWELLESDVCDQTDPKKGKFQNIIPILKKHCVGIRDIGVIKLTPHLLDGYVSVKFDRESNAFSMSGLGLGECFHYSIFVANALA